MESRPIERKFCRLRFLQDQLHDCRVIAADPLHLPVRKASCDFVVLNARLPMSTWTKANTRDVFDEVRSMLVPGGVICVRSHNGGWAGKIRAIRRQVLGRTEVRQMKREEQRRCSSPRRVAYQLRMGGFRGIQQYYVDPSLEDPSSVIPINRRASRFYVQSRLRKNLAMFGFHGLFFPAFLSLARR